ncbi:MAG TPA: hypothetical protein VII75_15545 [Thermoanaerobaculia bacterium]
MRKISHHVCGVIPPHILAKVAEQAEHEARDDARSTLEQMRELATDGHGLSSRAPRRLQSRPFLRRNAAASTTRTTRFASPASS